MLDVPPNMHKSISSTLEIFFLPLLHVPVTCIRVFSSGAQNLILHHKIIWRTVNNCRSGSGNYAGLSIIAQFEVVGNERVSKALGGGGGAATLCTCRKECTKFDLKRPWWQPQSSWNSRPPLSIGAGWIGHGNPQTRVYEDHMRVSLWTHSSYKVQTIEICTNSPSLGLLSPPIPSFGGIHMSECYP